ncbi:MAG: trypsin-like peptidase domain-containing protein [Lachnospiraceae bacterium]|nr:trypsin-like peptidase domain-containing protein [Lachnospiraceae bacterium]
MKNKPILIFVLLFSLLLYTGCGNTCTTEEEKTKPVASDVKTETIVSIPVTKLSDPGEAPDETTLETLASSVLKLEVFDDKDTRTATGTGFVYGDPALLVTSAHVIINMDHLEATKDNGETFTVTAKAVYLDKDKDIAMFRLPEDISIPALEAATDLPGRGTNVFTIGSQAGLTNLVTTGIVSGIWNDGSFDYLIFTAPVSGGNSGGPIFDDTGKLIGIVIGTYEKAQNLNIGLSVQELPETE